MHQSFTGVFLIDVATLVGTNSAFAFLLETSGEDPLWQWPTVVAVGQMLAEDSCGKNASEIAERYNHRALTSAGERCIPSNSEFASKC